MKTKILLWWTQDAATELLPEESSTYPCTLLNSKKKGKVVPVLNLIKHYAMKAYGVVDV
jgi:hypothetical protein